MSIGNHKRTRSDLVSSLNLPPGQIARGLAYLQRRAVLLRLVLCLLAAGLLWLVTSGWQPAFPYRSGYIPPRDIVAHTSFSRPDPEKTEARRRQRRSETICVYQHDARPLFELRKALENQVLHVIGSESLEQVNAEFWQEFQPAEEAIDAEQAGQRYEAFRAALAEDKNLALFNKAVQNALADYERHGLLENLEHKLEEGSQTAISVHPVGNESFRQRVAVRDVRIAEATDDLLQRLQREFAAVMDSPSHAETLAQLVFCWLKNHKLPATLALNESASQAAREEAVRSEPQAQFVYQVGDKLASGGEPLTRRDLELLRREYDARVAQTSTATKFRYSLAQFGMYIALYVLSGCFVYYHAPRLLNQIRQFITMLALVVVTVGLCSLVSIDAWRAEIIPLGLFGMIVAIVYERDLALVLSAVLALLVTFTLGQGLPEFLILMASVAAAILLLTRVRSRTKLIYVGLFAGLVALLTTIGVGTLTGQAFASQTIAGVSFLDTEGETSFGILLLIGAGWFAFCALLTGVLMTGLLPFIERIFDVQTDISLLELGDAAHPLLQELARRAPGTYNHSINVASISEAAADAIGANGLLVRVGAYFHDIGKMLKPGYFVENQGLDANRHESLVPAMSTLVIVAHVKDGADLARQHRLPQSIIDFIEQHHGTTLVEYFYREATRQHEDNPDGGDVQEATFRYPGPKPRTREAAVMMLADAVESASRALTDPTPARIENLVREIAMKRLLDGQFEDCGLTLREMHAIEDSLVKSVTAIYHGRVKYPEQQTASA